MQKAPYVLCKVSVYTDMLQLLTEQEKDVKSLQVFDILAVLNVMELFALPAVESAEQQNPNQSRQCRRDVTQYAHSLQPTLFS